MLAKCPECGNSVSTLAASCPHCGAPSSAIKSDTTTPTSHVSLPPPPSLPQSEQVPLTHEAPTQELGADKHGLSSSAKHVQTGQAGKKSKVRRSFWTGKEKPPLETAGEYNARIAEQKAKIPPPPATDLPPSPQRGGVKASGRGIGPGPVPIGLAI